MNGAGRCAKFWNQDAKFIPGEIDKIECDKQRNAAQENTASRETFRTGQVGCWGHEIVNPLRFYTQFLGTCSPKHRHSAIFALKPHSRSSQMPELFETRGERKLRLPVHGVSGTFQDLERGDHDAAAE